MASNKPDHLGQAVDANHDRIEALRRGEVSYEVTGDDLPEVLGCFIRGEKSEGFLPERLGALACRAAVHVFEAVLGNGRPPEVTLNEFKSLGSTRVTCEDGVMVFLDDALAEKGKVWDNNPVVPAGESIFE